MSAHEETIAALETVSTKLYDLVYGTLTNKDGSITLSEDQLKDFDAIVEDIEELKAHLGEKG